MKIVFRIWRQTDSRSQGHLIDYPVEGLNTDMSFLEALDYLNEQLVRKNEKVVAFEYDCREGICGQCGLFINGRAHGPLDNTTTCQLHMRSFRDGDTVVVEPWRAKAFPIIQDLVVDRSAFDRVMQAGGYISAHTGSAPEANSIPIGKEVADRAMDAAACIGCGACAAACKNASAALFTAAKINHLNALPQGRPEARKRLKEMAQAMELEGFGHCSFTGACEVECPENISIRNIAEINFRSIASILRG